MPNVFRPELEEEQIEPQETAEAQKASSPRQDPTQQRQNILQRLEALKKDWQEKDNTLKEQIKAASGPEKKFLKRQQRNNRLEATLKAGTELSEATAWVPLVGDIVKSSCMRAESTDILFFGVGSQGEVTQLDERVKQSLVLLAKSEALKLKAAVELVLLIGLPETAVARLAVAGARGSKLAKAGAWVGKAALDLRKAHHLAQDVTAVTESLDDLRRGEVDWETGIRMVPVVLRQGIAPRLEGAGRIPEAAATKYAGQIIGKIPRETLIAEIESVPPEADSQIALDIHQFAKLIPPESEGVSA